MPQFPPEFATYAEWAADQERRRQARAARLEIRAADVAARMRDDARPSWKAVLETDGDE
jgi:hypothetical protein